MKTLGIPEPRNFIGRVESVDRHTNGVRSRFTFVLDAVDETVDPNSVRTPVSAWQRRDFALLRVMTTYKKFAEMAELVADDPDDLVGQWVALSLIPHGKIRGPIVQVCPLGEGGYEEVQRYTATSMTAFGSDPEFPGTLGAAGDHRKQVAARFAAAGRAFSGTTSVDELDRIAQRIGAGAPVRIQVHDVGHANFTTVFADDRQPLFHFDVGWPIGFNRKTISGPTPVIKPAPIVILSHWDWDHLHGYHVWRSLQEKTWVAPVQDLGPGALKIAKELEAAGRLVSVVNVPPTGKKFISGASFEVGTCDPGHAKSKAQTRNNSGLFAALKLASGKLALLPGDADYQAVMWPYATDPSCLVVSHHGAAVNGPLQHPNAAN